jgi:hypothetical protein
MMGECMTSLLFGLQEPPIRTLWIPTSSHGFFGPEQHFGRPARVGDREAVRLNFTTPQWPSSLARERAVVGQPWPAVGDEGR